MNFILYILLPLVAFILGAAFAKLRARRNRQERAKAQREFDEGLHAISSAFGGRSYPSNAAGQRAAMGSRRIDDDIMNPLHPLSQLNPIGPLNMSNLSSSSDDSHRPHSSQACYTGSDPHESSRHSSGSDWGSSSSSDSSSYSSSDSGSSSSSCD